MACTHSRPSVSLSAATVLLPTPLQDPCPLQPSSGLRCLKSVFVSSVTFVSPRTVQFLLDICFLEEVAVKFHFSSRQLQQVADTSMERAKEAFDIDG